MWADTVDKHFPRTESNFKTSMLDMDEEWQFPYAFCAIDGSHLPIKCPDGGGEAMKQYYSFKNFYSVILFRGGSSLLALLSQEFNDEVIKLHARRIQTFQKDCTLDQVIVYIIVY